VSRPPKNNYEILDIPIDASVDAIRFAYGRALDAIKRERPDDAGAIAEVRKAYEILSDTERRTAYDSRLARVPGRPATRDAVALEAGSSNGWMKWMIGALVIAIGFGVYAFVRKKEESAEIGPRTVRMPTQTTRSNTAEPVTAASTSENASAPSNAAKLTSEQLFSAASPSIARITAKNTSGNTVAIGSGVVIDSSHIITNCHVAQQGQQLSARVGRDTLNAIIDIADEEFDLCRLSVSQMDAPAATIGRVADLRTGQRVYAIGAPQGLDLTLSDGLVSALREFPEGTVIQTSAPVSPGSSGGGLFDANGKLVGIITFQHRFGQNLNFAVPVDWIGEMRTRGPSKPQTVAADITSSKPDDLREVLLKNKWYCFNALSGFNGELAFTRDGYVTYTRSNKAARGFFYVNGKTLTLNDIGGNVSTVLESMSPDKLIFSSGGGNRMVCDKR
jgi:serine protease Do